MQVKADWDEGGHGVPCPVPHIGMAYGQCIGHVLEVLRGWGVWGAVGVCRAAPAVALCRTLRVVIGGVWDGTVLWDCLRCAVCAPCAEVGGLGKRSIWRRLGLGGCIGHPKAMLLHVEHCRVRYLGAVERVQVEIQGCYRAPHRPPHLNTESLCGPMGFRGGAGTEGSE